MNTRFRLLARSGLARRTFTVLAIALAVVVAGVLWITTEWSARYLDEQMQRETAIATKQYGLGTFQRLDLAAIALRSTPATAQNVSAESDPRLAAFFDAVKTIPTTGTQAPDSAHPDQLQLRVTPNGDSTYSIELVDHRTAATVVGRISHRYLWQPDSFPADGDVLVADSAGHRLLGRNIGDSAENSSQPPEKRYTARWSLFLRERFNAEEWHFEMSRGEGERSEYLAKFRLLLFAVLLPLMAAMALLTSVLIRRSHQPLERLVAATQELASGRFDARVEEIGDRDSRGLIRAFNDMTARIALSWRAMQLLSRIDHSILVTPNFDEIVRLALRESPAVLHCLDVAVLKFSDKNSATLLWLSRGRGEQLERSTVSISNELLALLHTCGAVTVEAQDADWIDLGTSWRRDSAHAIHLTAIRQGTTLRGAVLTRRSAANVTDAESLSNQLHLAERLAVALASYEREQLLIQSAHFDDLTLLANRRYFQQHLHAEVARCAASKETFALLFLDLDRFKLVNDATGHGSGDKLLRAVADRLRLILNREYFVARLGGDEFTIVIPDEDQPESIAQQAELILRELSEPIVVQQQAHAVSASIGIAIYPEHGDDADTLLRNADTAMYRAKRSKSQRYCFYQSEMNVAAVQHLRVEQDLRQALANDELVVHYQPQVDIASGKVIGVEALLRWSHPRLGMLSPEHFLDIAEDSGLIVPIGEWVFEQACAQYRRWRADGIDVASLAVNASVAQLMSARFVPCVQAAMERYHLPRGVLEVEITETALAENMAVIRRVLEELRALGARIAIDDFGVGYSSLSYLHQLPFDTLKIDRLFIPTIEPGTPVDSLCETIIAMANTLHKDVVAEGVETVSQEQFLKQHGCNSAQGFLYAEPLPADAFAKYCLAHQLQMRAAG